MANGDRQEKSLETLKLINAASTSIRLYPEATARVEDAIETAYQGTKSFLRDHKLLRFSFLDGVDFLNGEPVGKRIQERLALLTFREQMQKMALDELVLSRTVDRATFRKMLSVFSTTPEQVQQAGGNRSFIESLHLTDIFPEQYVAPGESVAERQQKSKIDGILAELSGGVVQPEQILYLAGRKEGDDMQITLQKDCQSPDHCSRIIATTTFTLLQILLKDHVVVVAPAFPLALNKINSLLNEDLFERISKKTAGLLAPYLDETVVLMLLCQDFATPFGEHFYAALIQSIDTQVMLNVLDWMKGQQEKAESQNSTSSPQLLAVSLGYDKLTATSRGKQLLALENTREKLEKTAYGRKEKRVHAGIMALAKGDLESLKNEEVCLNLPSVIEKLLANEKESVAAVIVQNIVSGLTDPEHSYRLHLAQAVGGVAEKLGHIKRWDWLEKLTPVCMAWIRENDSAGQHFEKHVEAMQAMMNHAWHSDNTELAEHILDVFYYIRSGALEKSESVREIVCKVQDRNVDLDLLQTYLDRCFVKPVNEMICKKITMQGPVAARFLLDKLINSEKRSDRIRLLKILSQLGDEFIPVLLERLPDPMPWFGKRNIIRLLAATGSEKDVESILDYVFHDDLRVQQETLHCIVQIGGASTERYLLKVLDGASTQAKLQVVKNLRRVADSEVIGPLSELLEECKLYRGSEKRLLALEISKTLGATGTRKAFPLLRKIIDGGEKQFGKESVHAAELGISYIQEQGTEEIKLQDGRGRKVPIGISPAKTPDGDATYECITSYPEEKKIYELLQKGEKESAKEQLFKLIEKTTQFQNFDEAESLRLRLIDIDPMALTEIIKAAEIIEEAKSNSVDKDHILIWSDLYDLLSTEEFNTFYLALEHETYSTETAIVTQGEPQWRLFFVNKGRVKLFFHEKESETLVHMISKGNVFGGNSFFDNSVWTLNATSMGAVELSTLSMDKVEEWGEVYPSLEKKLQEYCRRYDKVNDFFIASGANRRQEERRTLSGNVYMVLSGDGEDASETIIRGECSDISSGGLSFLAKIGQKRNARLLLGRQVRLFFKDDDQEDEKLSLSGTVVAVRNLNAIDMGRSVHIHFDEELEQSIVTDLVNVS